MSEIYRTHLTLNDFESLGQGSFYGGIGGKMDPKLRRVAADIERFGKNEGAWHGAVLETTAPKHFLEYRSLKTNEQRLAFMDQYVNAALVRLSKESPHKLPANTLTRYHGWVLQASLKHILHPSKPWAYTLPLEFPRLAQDLRFYHTHRKRAPVRDSGINQFKDLAAFSSYVDSLKALCGQPTAAQQKKFSGEQPRGFLQHRL